MRLLYVACLHSPENHERWLIKHFRNRGVEVIPFDYRMISALPDAAANVNSQLLVTVRALKVDKVFIVKGEQVTKETIQTLNDMGVTTACWMLDDQEGSAFYDCPYSHIFTTSPRLIPKHQKRCNHVYELASYVEPSIFQLDENIQRKYPEVSFLGTKYPGREEKLTYLREHGCPVEVYGDQWTIPNKGRPEYLDCLRLWRHSKVNVNMHQEKCRDVGSVNMKCFEIPAIGGFAVTDYFPEILDKFASDEVVLYNWDDDSLLKTVQYWLDDPEGRVEVVKRAQGRILRDHTAEKRVDYILAHI